jgi:hypothetical protein
VVLEVERFYEIEVNVEQLLPGEPSTTSTRRVQGGLTVGDVEPEAVSG